MRTARGGPPQDAAAADHAARRRIASMVALAVIAADGRAPAQEATAPTTAPRAGTWRASLASPGGELPFGLKLSHDGRAWQGSVENGHEVCALAAVAIADGRIRMSFAPYESEIDAAIEADGTRLRGVWRARRDGTAWTELGFDATFGAAPRFAARTAAIADPRDLPARFAVAFSGDEQPAVLVVRTGDDGRAHGTFLTTLGDYRYLEGAWDGELLRLSCFDGAHAFLFRAARLPDGTLAGDFWSKDSWHETFVARPDPDARLPDAFGLTSPQPDVALHAMRFADLDGVEHALDAAEFAGRARIVFVFGTWCPNCRDATRLLVDFDARYRARGLRILGLAFERTGDAAIDGPQVRRYAASQGVHYPILLGGAADKASASAALPLLDRLRAYPTTIFLDANGTVRAVHTGFSGPATGDEHQALRRRFTALIEDLLQ